MAVKLQFELCYYFPKMLLSYLNEVSPLDWVGFFAVIFAAAAG